MKLEQTMMSFGMTSADNGYIDLARAASAVNGRMISQTKRSKGKYKPLGFLVRVRALTGNITVETLNCGYPTRNAVVLGGHARDEMLKSAGVSRSNLESYQKELRILMEDAMSATGTNTFFPESSDKGTTPLVEGWGNGLTYDYTQLVIEDPASPGDTLTKTMAVIGKQAGNSTDWAADNHWYLISNWYNWRHSYTPAAADDDIDNNVISWAIQQSDTAEAISDIVEAEADEKPYDFLDFIQKKPKFTVGTGVGNPTSSVICAPLGLLKVTSGDSASWEVEIVGVTEL